jgi:hypothetical protein
VGKLGHLYSEDLQAAQRRLMLLRAQLGTSHSQANTRQVLLCETAKQHKRPFLSRTAVSQLPPHLGWESTAVTQTLRQTPATKSLQPTIQSLPPTDSPHPTYPKTVKVYPDIAIGLLRQEMVASGRLWLLLQAADSQRRGWVDEKAARQLFTSKRAPLRFCGPRQLRNLLAGGDGVLWTRGNGRIWLRSAAKVAFGLDVSRLQMRPVAVPLRVLRQKIGTVRAHLYATFHSSRSRESRVSNPIARATVARITQVQPRTQRRYDRKAQVKQERQFAIGSQATKENIQARAWQQGQAVFQFKDFKGKQGSAGNSYVAWQLPNSYVGPHARLPKGRQKRINRALTDLFMQGMTGNGQRSRCLEQHFFGNGRLASKATLQNPKDNHYWRGRGNGRFQLWQVIEGHLF